MYVGNVYSFPKGFNDFKFLVLEDEKTCEEKYQGVGVVKVWIFEVTAKDIQKSIRTGITFFPVHYLEGELTPLYTLDPSDIPATL